MAWHSTWRDNAPLKASILWRSFIYYLLFCLHSVHGRVQSSVEWRQLTGGLIYTTVIVTVGYIAIVSTVKRGAAIISTDARQYKLEETPSGVHWIIFLNERPANN